MSTNDNNLYPEKTLQPATSGSRLVSQEVQRASRQLALAGQVGKQLVLNDERRRWVALLSRIKPENAVKFLSIRMPLSLDLLERYKDKWEWFFLPSNESLPWSLELIERFAWYGFFMLFANYLTQSTDMGALGFSQSEKGWIMGVGTGILYFLPLILFHLLLLIRL